MKRIFTVAMIFVLPLFAVAQNFTSYIATAKTAYAGGKLEESRFAMEQMMQELDITMGKEVLKLLPSKLEVLEANLSADNVTGMSGFLGVLIHREYGKPGNFAELDLITNSPLAASINTILSIPILGGSGDGNQKRIKIDGYKGLLQKNVNSETQKTSYELQMPFNSTLLTFKMESNDEAKFLKMAAEIPIAEISKMLQ